MSGEARDTILGVTVLVALFGGLAALFCTMPRPASLIEVARCVEKCEAAGSGASSVDTHWGWSPGPPTCKCGREFSLADAGATPNQVSRP